MKNKFSKFEVLFYWSGTQHVVDLGALPSMGGETLTKVYNVSSYPGYKAFTKYNFVVDITEFEAWCDTRISEGSTSTRPFSTSYNAATGEYTLHIGSITGDHMWPRPSAGRLYLVYYG